MDFSSFCCGKCHTEIHASSDMIGQEAECPACGEKFIIPPPKSADASRRTAEEMDPATVEAMKSRTIRIQLDDL